jgi:hypothetical protein
MHMHIHIRHRRVQGVVEEQQLLRGESGEEDKLRVEFLRRLADR